MRNWTLWAALSWLACSPLFAMSTDPVQPLTASYRDIMLRDTQARYYLSALALRLGIPSDATAPFEQDLAVYPKAQAILVSQIFRSSIDSALQLAWHNHTLTLQVNPALSVQAISYNALLQTALALIQEANNQRLPVLNGQALKTALENKTGVPTVIFHRQGRTMLAVHHSRLNLELHDYTLGVNYSGH